MVNETIINQTITKAPNFFSCWNSYSTLVTSLFIYGVATTIIVIILIWILRNNFKKNSGVIKNES